MTSITLPLPRRAFVAVAGASLALATKPTRAAASHACASDARSFPRQDLSLVREMVGVSHGNLSRVRELVAERPELAKSSWDWGFGDWESALGASSHKGRREIAEVLMAHGARPNLFTFAMLGRVDAVRAMIEAEPDAQRTLGPHGITLLSHARAGGDESADVVSYLSELGGADDGQKTIDLTAEQIKIYLGTFASEQTGQFEIIESRGMIWITPKDGDPRSLFLQEDGSFFPAGAPSVRLRFRLSVAQATAVVFSNPGGEPIVAGRV